jgi:UDP:flavonoid glycosyltransferase YjiC (YdhE family)
MRSVRILVASLGAYGHLYPLMPLALAAADAGHEVVIATGEPFLDRLPLPTVPAYTDLTLDDAIAETRRRHPDAQGEELSIALFADVTAGHIAPAMLEQLNRIRPDLCLFEPLMTGTGVAASVLDVPAVAFSIGLHHAFYPPVHGATIAHQRTVWASRGLEAPAGPLLATALLDPTPPSLRTGETLDIETLPVRPVAYSEASAAVPDWLLATPTRPRVYLTLGTVSFGAVEVLNRALADLAGLDVDVLAAVGPEGDPSLLEHSGEWIHVERFVAQSRVLPLVDVMVHHGGTGSVLSALEAGVPQLILPQGADQFLNADLLVSAGAGRALLNDDQAPGAIAEAVSTLLADGPERVTAAEIQSEIAAMPAPADVLDQLVALVR